MTYQARFDFVVVDPDALLTYVETRLAQSGEPWTPEQIIDHDPFDLLTHHDGLGFPAADEPRTGHVRVLQ
jgi:hypothetical protein